MSVDRLDATDPAAAGARGGVRVRRGGVHGGHPLRGARGAAGEHDLRRHPGGGVQGAQPALALRLFRRSVYK
eukprot:2210222-Pyramimonas_sp.AAC.1